MFWFFKKSPETPKKDDEVVKKDQSLKSVLSKSERKDLMNAKVKKAAKAKSSEALKTSDTFDEKENSLLIPTVFEHVNADAPPAVTRMRKHRIFKKEDEEATQLDGEKRKSGAFEEKIKKHSEKGKNRRSESSAKNVDADDSSVRLHQLEEELKQVRDEIGTLSLTVAELQKQLTTVNSQLLEMQGLKQKRDVLSPTFQPPPVDASWLGKTPSMTTTRNGVVQSAKTEVPQPAAVQSAQRFAESVVRPSLAASEAPPNYIIKDYRLVGGKLVPYYVPKLQPKTTSMTASQSIESSGSGATKSLKDDEKSTYL